MSVARGVAVAVLNSCRIPLQVFFCVECQLTPLEDVDPLEYGKHVRSMSLGLLVDVVDWHARHHLPFEFVWPGVPLPPLVMHHYHLALYDSAQSDCKGSA